MKHIHSSFSYALGAIITVARYEPSPLLEIKYDDEQLTVPAAIASIMNGRRMGSSLFGANKKTAVVRWLEERHIPPENVCFYSDSYTDIPLLEWCGHPSAVNPDRLLAREAKSRGWNILRFRETAGRSHTQKHKGCPASRLVPGKPTTAE
jgi:hypothetical protein